MRMLIVTDAWLPQVNGVVRTWQATSQELAARGHDVRFLTPEGRSTIPLPFYPDIPLSLVTGFGIGAEIDKLRPDIIHIATEGTLGWAARRACLRRHLPFTTSFHTRFAEYIGARIPLSGITDLVWTILLRFHRPSRGVMVATPSFGKELAKRGFSNVRNWSRGVDRELYKPGSRDRFDLPRPLLLYAGRVAVEKNIEAFLNLDVEGTKIVVGDGPDRERLERTYPAAVFTGYLFNADYAHALSSADVFVFSSLTDTFGLVMLEAIACGTPVAAFNVTSPIDVVDDGMTGAVDPDLAAAVSRALQLDRAKVHEGSFAYSWARTADLFETFIVPIDWPMKPRTSPALSRLR